MAGTRYIVAGRFIDGSGTEVQRHVFLAVKDKVITAIGPVADLPCNAGAVIDDFSHCTILPALVDCIVSLLRSPSVDERVQVSLAAGSPAQKAAVLRQHISYCHSHGVLGVAASDDIVDLMALDPKVPASEGGIVIRTAGHPGLSGDGVADNAVPGDFLRIAYSANIEDEETPHPQLGRDDLGRILQHRNGRKTVVVANGRQQVAEALAAGCDGVEQGYGMGEDNLREMAARDVLWIPGVLRVRNALDGASSGGSVCCRFSHRYVAPGKPVPGAEAFWKKILAEQLAQLRLAKEFGVTTALGTGAGSVGILHGEAMVEEMKLFIKAGYSLEESIRCASANGAGFFGMAELGELTVGRKATFLISRGTIPQLPRKLAYLEGIYVDGRPSNTYCKNPVRAV